MKLPLILLVVLFGTGILLSGQLSADPRSVLVAVVLFVVAGFVLLSRRWVLAAALVGGLAWLSLGVAAAGFERVARPTNLASAMIESGKLDSSVALRWHGTLRENPLRLPWGIRYDIDLDQVESASGISPVTGGLRLTSYHVQPDTQSLETQSTTQSDGQATLNETSADPPNAPTTSRTTDTVLAMAGDSVEVLARDAC